MTIIAALFNVFGLMVREFVFVLMQITVCSEITFDEDLCHVETSQLIVIAMRLFGFYIARHIIEGNFRTFRGFLNVTLFAHLCFRLIELMPLVFFFYLTCCLIIVQECAKLFRFEDLCNIAGQLEFSAIANLPKNCSVQIIFPYTVIQWFHFLCCLSSFFC